MIYWICVLAKLFEWNLYSECQFIWSHFVLSIGNAPKERSKRESQYLSGETHRDLLNNKLRLLIIPRYNLDPNNRSKLAYSFEISSNRPTLHRGWQSSWMLAVLFFSRHWRFPWNIFVLSFHLSGCVHLHIAH